MKTDYICLIHGFLCRLTSLYIVFLGKFFVPVEIKADNLHSECIGSFCNFFPNPAQSDDGYGFTHNFIASYADPLPCCHMIGFLYEFSKKSQHQGESMFSHGCMVYTRAEC